MRFFKTPYFLRLFYPSMLWEMPEGQKKLYLTFDDGPHPEITPAVLDLLKRFNAKATFFCIGKNIKSNPEVFERILSEGHSVGNHTCNHNMGWKTDTKTYVDSVNETYDIMCSCSKNHNPDSLQKRLLRPPYGKIKSSQIKILKKNYKLVAWTVISYDWDKTLRPEECFNKVIENVKDGSIIVFHDSEKAVKNMLPTLSNVLEYYSERNYTFERL